MLNIVIPMAGQGQRFVDAGYKKPKPFIDVGSKPMIERVMNNLMYPAAKYILIARQEHLESEKGNVNKLSKKYNCEFIGIDKLTEGTACTVLFARKLINNDQPLIIANSDQIIDINFSQFVDDALNSSVDGSILTFEDKELNPKWSFAEIDSDGFVKRVKEKEAISQYATVGIYLFAKGKDFVDSAVDMIISNDRVNNEFYTCPAYNYAIKRGKKVKIFNMQFEQMHGIGTPEDLQDYLTILNEK